MARERVPLIVIQRQLGHTSRGVTSIYLQGIDSAEIIDAVHARRAPTIPVDASLRLEQAPVVVRGGSGSMPTQAVSQPRGGQRRRNRR
jgi:hypothetical protein